MLCAGRCTIVLVLALGAASMLLGTQAASQGVSLANIVLITIDTLRADRVGAYGYAGARTPALDRLASRGARFDQATAHAPLTVPSHVSILTGQYPSRHGSRDNGAAVVDAALPTAASLLHERGYKTAAFVATFLLAAQYGFDRGFEHFDDELPPSGPMLDFDLRRPAEVVAARATAWLQSNARQPFFVWVHFYDPHSPYPAPLASRDLPQPYDAAVAAADAGVATLVKTLGTLGLTDRTAIITTADHGEGLGDHGEREHGLLLYDTVLRVPLIVDLPGGRGRVVTRQVRHIDLLPTFLEIAGVKPPAALLGRSLLGMVRDGDAAAPRDGDDLSYAESWYGRLHFGWSELRSIRVDGWKYIDGPRPALYNVRRDPGESTNLVQQRTDLAARLRREVQTIADGEAPQVSAKVDEATAERLGALGYVSGGPPSAGALARPGADPGEMLPLFEKYEQALNAGVAALRAERVDAAIAQFRQLTTAFPDSYEAQHYLGYAYAAAGRNQQAVAAYTRALVIFPDYATARFNLAKALGQLGQVRQARSELQRGFATEPRSFYGQMIAGLVAWNANDDRAAIDAFSRAVEISPIEPRAHANLGEARMRAGDFRGARAPFEALVRLKFQPAAAHFNLGVIAERLGELAQARAEYRQALAIDPKFQPARQALDALR